MAAIFVHKHIYFCSYAIYFQFSSYMYCINWAHLAVTWRRLLTFQLFSLTSQADMHIRLRDGVKENRWKKKKENRRYN